MSNRIKYLFFVSIFLFLPALIYAATIEGSLKAEEQDTLGYLEDSYPDAYHSLLETKKNNAEVYDKQLSQYKDQVGNIEYIKREFPDFYKLYTQKKPLPELTRREEQNTLSQLKNNYPDVYQGLLEAKKTNPQAYKEQLASYKEQMDNLEYIKREFPDFYRLISSLK